eukprot:CAMPEP_0119142538 /NCGR_PEP_ID=MMETSP1310-20130426/32821_1 /TAXON_ID=464262 /ORGANISM="Genus nov. species nov., Strain RCC2339" /LENGTH=34 /DNA_ID= /DNA_START= /DNA_END= /DNA_ORIENTATION=
MADLEEASKRAAEMALESQRQALEKRIGPRPTID